MAPHAIPTFPDHATEEQDCWPFDDQVTFEMWRDFIKEL